MPQRTSYSRSTGDSSLPIHHRRSSMSIVCTLKFVASEIIFDWDEGNLNHLAAHKISREEAEQVIVNGFAELGYQFQNDEERDVIVGVTNSGRFVTLVLTYRSGAVRPITGWDTTIAEETQYWAQKGS